MEPVRPPDFNPATPPEQSAVLSTVVGAMRVALGAVPVLGGVVSEGLGALVAWNAVQKTQAWLQVLEDRLEYLDARTINLEGPEKAQEIVSMTLAAALAAAKTSADEKLRMLQNAVLNTAVSDTTGADERMVFLRFVDELTPTQVRILTTIRGLTESTERDRLYDLNQVYEAITGLCPDPKLDFDTFLVFFTELRSRALVRFGMGETGALRLNASSPLRFSSAGGRFLRFIEDPERVCE